MDKQQHTEPQHLHTPEAIRERLEQGPGQRYLRDFIYGAVDGLVTTFAVVSGVAGAGLSSGIIIVLGMANLLADGFSMAVSNFLGIRAENQMREKSRREEHLHIKLFPEGEREEIRQIYALKGFSGEQLEHIVEVITSDRSRWVETMLQEEFGMPAATPAPARAGTATFFAFVLIGVVPLMTFLWNVFTPYPVIQPFFWSAVLTGVAFFVVGAFKGQFVCESWIKSGLETLCLGGAAAALAYGVGVLLKGFVA